MIEKYIVCSGLSRKSSYRVAANPADGTMKQDETILYTFQIRSLL